ncbi:hypothetical protein cypCar_00034145 [Cyprinus carpio]|nr:hypothetical protein cypCar_00034145 [Cyprinus carpio]
MVEMFLNKQGSSALVLGMVEPLLSVIENGMSSETSQQEQDFLRKAADIFRNRLCRAKYYCRETDGREAELHEMLERLIGRAQKLTDSSVSPYYFSAALYVLKVLRGVVSEQDSANAPSTPAEVLCVNLLDTAVENITAGVREHQQGQACLMVLRALQSKDVKNLMSDAQGTELHQKVVDQLAKSFEDVQCKNKMVREKIVKALELCQHLVRSVHTQEMPVNLELLQKVLESMNAEGSLQKPGQLEDMYWSVMKLFCILKPKMEKVKKVVEAEQTEETTKKNKKKKGFLPETKKRKNRKKPTVLEGKETPASTEGASGGEKKNKKKDKKRKQQGGEGEQTQNQPATKKAKTQPQQNKKKKKKGGQQEADGK